MKTNHAPAEADFNEADVRTFYRWLNHGAEEFTEIRGIPWPPGTAPVTQLWVNNEEAFVKACSELSGKKQVYAGVNPRKRKGGTAEDVARVVVIPFDVDSPHPKGQAATEAELEEAKERATELVSWICMKGFRTPLVAMSGNGFHVIQKVDIEYDSHETIRTKLEAYFHEAPTEGMDSVFDLPRIMKVPGTLSVKGAPTEERPHRLSYIVSEGSHEEDKILQQYIENVIPYIEKVNVQEKIDRLIEKPYYLNPKIRKLRPCFRHFVDRGGRLSENPGDDHLLRLALVQEAHVNKFSRAKIIDLFRNSVDFKQDVTAKAVDHELRDIANKGPITWTCAKIQAHGGCLGSICSLYVKKERRNAVNQLVPKRLGDSIMETHKFAATSKKSAIWVYIPDKGIWDSNGEEMIQTLVTERLGELFKPKHASDVVDYIRYKNYVEADIFGGKPNKITLLNGVYNLDTGELEPFSPDNYELNAVPVTYNVNARCPKTEKFLDEVAPNDKDKIIEIIGYCLYKGYPIARLFVFTGAGRNGKSRAIKLIESFLGKKNTSSLTLYEISSDRFGVAQLHGKLANLAADIPATPIKYTGMIKLLTGEDSLSAQHKYRNRFEFTNYAKLIFSANEIPPTADGTLAWKRRLILVNFPNEFPPDDPKTDPNILDKIITPEEFSGLFNLAIEGLRTLLTRGKFTDEKTAEERGREWIRLSNPAQHFAENYVEMADNPMKIITKADMYQWYAKLCRAMGKHALPSNIFTSEVKPFLPYIDEGIPRLPTGAKDKKGKATTEKTRVWYGLKVKTAALLDEIKRLKAEKVERSERRNDSIPPKKPPATSIVKRERGIENRSTVPIVPKTPGAASSAIKKLQARVAASGQVGELVPRLFLMEKYGYDEVDADNVVNGLREAGKLVQLPSGEWEVPE